MITRTLVRLARNPTHARPRSLLRHGRLFSEPSSPLPVRQQVGGEALLANVCPALLGHRWAIGPDVTPRSRTRPNSARPLLQAARPPRSAAQPRPRDPDCDDESGKAVRHGLAPRSSSESEAASALSLASRMGGRPQSGCALDRAARSAR